MTLIEVVVVTAIIGVIAGMTSLVVPRVLQPPADDPGRVLAESRRRALRDGSAQTTWLLIDSVAHEVLLLPDGSVVADTGVALDRFSARWRGAP